MSRVKRSQVSVAEVAQTHSPVVLASANEAVAGVADKLMKLSPNQRAFLRLRFYYETDADCAVACGLAKQTVRQWKVKKNSDFLAVYEELLLQPILHARAEMALLTNMAIDTIGDLMRPGNHPSTRLAAADKVLKSRDTQMLTNNIKVEDTGDGGDLYLALMRRLRTRKEPAVTVEPVKPEPDGEVVEAEFRALPAGEASDSTTDSD